MTDCSEQLPEAPAPPPCTRNQSDRAHCWVGHWRHGIGGVPATSQPWAPLLGNGYAGVLLAEGAADGLDRADNSSAAVDLWVNTNAMWGCKNNTASRFQFPLGPSGRLTPAICNLLGFGGVSLSLPALGRPVFYAEQRIGSAQLYTRQKSEAGTLETLTYMDPEQNTIVVNVTWRATGGPAAAQLNVAAWALGEDTIAPDGKAWGGPSAAGHRGSVLYTWRDGPKPSNDTAIRRIRTVLGVALPAGAAAIPPTLRKSGTWYHHGLQPVSRVVAASSVPIQSGRTVSIVISVRDNLLAGDRHDPLPDAVASAQRQAASVGRIASRAAVWWRSFWAKSSITLPQSPSVESFWFGAQYALAIMNPSQEMMRRTNNLVPPAGPYGNQVTTDATAFPAFTMDYNQEATFCTRQFAPKPLACCADCALVSPDGVLPANHEEYFMGYAQPILDWMPAARLSAQAHAKQIGRVCPAESLQ